MPSTPRTRTFLRRALPVTVASALILPLAGCVGLLPSENSKQAAKKVSESHTVIYGIKAAPGSTVVFSDDSGSHAEKVNTLGAWTTKVTVTGIKSVSVQASAPEATGEGQTGVSMISCTISIDGRQAASNESTSDVGGGISCTASTAGV